MRLHVLLLQDEQEKETTDAQHVVELMVDNELTWTDWFGFQGDDLTEEVVAPQGILTANGVL